MGKIRLFCLPYAGGSAMVYTKWKDYLHEDIELCPVELAGRGMRFREPRYEQFEDVVEDLYHMMKDRLDDRPYAIYGHSFGCFAAYELAHKLQASHHQNPQHLFFAARRAPQVFKDEIPYHNLSMDELKNVLLRLGGTPQELFENKEMMNAFLPILLSDFRVLHYYRYQERADKLACAISALSGKEDRDISGQDLTAWKVHSEVGCRIYKVNGGHFFLNEHPEEVAGIINQTLELWG
ncbi:hypothetical protein CBW65_03645 [Tumebacillus avium]|uniref:Thioesterase domain-containing protein n=1 Tax=Tumebacillus avium TaxID=1903704 RepID=A0A1Y0IK95_9BACL|nr:alpha/beta fold hydrolase [Tumebacillus avium]ARU60256.1 hypothetical protein CBW65_03645 [Tumebacillus avium]